MYLVGLTLKTWNTTQGLWMLIFLLTITNVCVWEGKGGDYRGKSCFGDNDANMFEVPCILCCIRKAENSAYNILKCLIRVASQSGNCKSYLPVSSCDTQNASCWYY